MPGKYGRTACRPGARTQTIERMVNIHHMRPFKTAMGGMVVINKSTSSGRKRVPCIMACKLQYSWVDKQPITMQVCATGLHTRLCDHDRPLPRPRRE